MSNTIIKNFIYLVLIQVAYYIFPLISLPYLVRILGPEKYGLVAFAQSFIGYFILITNYGFDLSATREVSINRAHKEKLSEIFSSVIYTKALLLSLCFIILMVLLQLNKFHKDSMLYILTFAIILGQSLFPLWLFMGLEKMKYITIFTILERAVFTLTVFIFIKSPKDYIYVPLLNTVGYLTSGILGMYVSIFHFNITFKVFNMNAVLSQIRQGWNSFIATTCMSLYSTSNIFILGLFAGNTTIGYYAAAEKLIHAVQVMLAPLSKAVYPYISKTANEEKARALKFIKKVICINVVLGLVFSFTIFFAANLLIKTILGPMYKESIYILKILAFLPLCAAIVDVLGFQTMLPFKMDKELAKILLTAGIFNIIVAFLLIPVFFHIGAAIAFLTTMIFAGLLLFLYVKKKNIVF